MLDWREQERLHDWRAEKVPSSNVTSGTGLGRGSAAYFRRDSLLVVSSS